MGNLKVSTLDNNSTTIHESALDKFISGLRGEVLLKDHPDYDEVRKIWNGMIDKKPAVIVRCMGTADVIDCVNLARENNLLTSVRGGGHNIAGNAVCEAGLMIDLSLMKSVLVDPDKKRANVSAGCCLGEVDHETKGFGLIVPAGIVTTTGAAGLTLGGGFGWTSRKFGLTCDNVISYDVVTSKGEFIKASENQNPELLWGLKGGGGNFGIVTNFEFKLYGLGPQVAAGMCFYPFEYAKDVLNFYRQYSEEVPNEVTMICVLRCVPDGPAFPKSEIGKPMAVLGFCYSGPVEDGLKYAKPIGEIGKPYANMIAPMRFTELQSMLDAGQPKGNNYYWKAENLKPLTGECIDTLIEHVSNITSPTTLVPLFQMKGEVSSIGENDTAYSHRDAAIALNINASWDDPGEENTHIEWTRKFWKSLQPYSTGGGYINFQSNDEGEERVQTTYGSEKLKRLTDLKNEYDPGNLFRLNQNIKPSV
jgi:FAD/FMN-containing dehydrogenase